VTSKAIPLVGRALLAAIFILSGVAKIFAAEATQGYIAHVGLPFPQLAFLGAVVLEIGGGLLLGTFLTLFVMPTAYTLLARDRATVKDDEAERAAHTQPAE